MPRSDALGAPSGVAAQMILRQKVGLGATTDAVEAAYRAENPLASRPMGLVLTQSELEAVDAQLLFQDSCEGQAGSHRAVGYLVRRGVLQPRSRRSRAIYTSNSR